jgi:hypothetical protein
MNPNAFDNFALNDNKYEIQIENYQLQQKESGSLESDEHSMEDEEYLAYNESKLPIIEPHICTWDYMTKSEVKTLLEIKRKSRRRKFIEEKFSKKPKGLPRILFRELIYTVTKFCKRSNFNLEQTGAVLSQFYLTHVFFTNSLNVGAEKLYEYFKELQLCHSLPVRNVF